MEENDTPRSDSPQDEGLNIDPNSPRLSSEEALIRANKFVMDFLHENFTPGMENYLLIVRDNPRMIEYHLNELAWLTEIGFYSGDLTPNQAHINLLIYLQMAFLMGYKERGYEIDENQKFDALRKLVDS